ncbi:iron-containing alcohol dehydrogenase family protein [Clostridium sp. BJN0001]|uniref:iron-containing alcohol dehydrogenase family protein n=1 Tax=Clostridium sp. BJN0001 TaxID=2930219 RepID=UPI001FD1C7D1|nr:iron-containing alcohol dehydrogenase family protein [Clostridium sp. BJN0001]
MNNYSVYLPCYSVGTECYKEIPYVTKRFGEKAVVIGGKTALSKAKDSILEGVKDSNVEILDFLWYGGNSTYENADMLLNNKSVRQADFVFAVGGGRAVDTCKVVADKLDKPLFTFPTIASNCAACTAIAVIYNSNDTFKEYYYIKAPAVHTFINTKIIAEAPESLFWAGIGDALSKETEVLFATRGKDLFHTPLLGAQLACACDKPLLDFGKKALDDCKSNKPSDELSQVALDIIISTGLVSNLTSDGDNYYYNSSLAHCVYYGSTLVKECSKHLHGEIVAFGVLCLLTYDKQYEKREKIFKFNKSVGLPTCLSDIGATKDDVRKMVKKSESAVEFNCAPYKITEDNFVKAILDCDKFSKENK